MAVDWGLAHRDLSSVAAIGVDELARRRGHRYLTLVYQIDRHHRRLLWVGRERKAATLQAFFDWFGAARSEALRFVCSDMWKPYLAVVAERAGQAVHVLDRFHIMSHFSKAIDERQQTARPVLRAAAGLHADQARRAISEVLHELRPCQPQAHELARLHLDPVQLEYPFRNIHSDDGFCALHAAPLRLPGKTLRPPLAL